MLLKNLNTNYNLSEFNLYIVENGDTCTSVIEMLVDCSIEEFEKNGLGETFFVETEKLTYVFSNFEINEAYKDGEFVKVVCVK